MSVVRQLRHRRRCEAIFQATPQLCSLMCRNYADQMSNWMTILAVAVGLASLVQGGLQWRLSRGMGGRGHGRRLKGTVVADSFLRAPVSHERCVLFVLSLARQKQDDTAGETLSFREQRPFAIVAGDERIRVDGNGQPFGILGIKAVHQALPILPATVEGLLVARFGRRGGLWAREHAVASDELILKDGAAVDAYLDGDRLIVLSTESLDDHVREVTKASWRSIAMGAVLTFGSTIAWWFTP
jgi:hypothetical protein